MCFRIQHNVLTKKKLNVLTKKKLNVLTKKKLALEHSKNAKFIKVLNGRQARQAHTLSLDPSKRQTLSQQTQS